MLCILVAHINIFTVSILPPSVFLLFSLWEKTPCNNLLRPDRVLLLFLWSLSALSCFSLLTPLPKLEHKTIPTLSLLAFPLNFCSQGCWIKDPLLPKCDLVSDLFLLYMAWMNKFPSENSIPWMKKKNPSRFLLLLMLSHFIFKQCSRRDQYSETPTLKKIHTSKLVSSLWMAKVSLKG